MKDIFGMYIRPVGLTHSEIVYVFDIALVRADLNTGGPDVVCVTE